VIDYPRPVLGFSAYSGTGKTTLLKRLLPKLREAGVRVAVIKHAHHRFEIDRPHKDSYELRKAGAVQMLVASRRRMALVTELDRQGEPALQELLAALDPERFDLVLVEGFKREEFPKIELHRPSLGRPLLCLQDRHIIALASDEEIPKCPGQITRLSINDMSRLTEFIIDFINNFRDGLVHEPSQPVTNRQLR
jgi:molybdopterin-guanine dinucleotide biosynthesis protein MobB